MKTRLLKTRLFWPLVAAFLVCPIAGLCQTANWDFALTQSDLSGPPGSTLIYAGTITNDTGSDLTITGVSLDFDTSPHADVFDLDFADEFVNTGLVIPSSGYTGPIFKLHWHPDATPNLAGFGAVEVFADVPADPASIPHVFAASVLPGGPAPSVPEPGSAALWGATLLVATLLAAGASLEPFARRKSETANCPSSPDRAASYHPAPQRTQLGQTGFGASPSGQGGRGSVGRDHHPLTRRVRRSYSALSSASDALPTLHLARRQWAPGREPAEPLRQTSCSSSEASVRSCCRCSKGSARQSRRNHPASGVPDR